MIVGKAEGWGQMPEKLKLKIIRFDTEDLCLQHQIGWFSKACLEVATVLRMSRKLPDCLVQSAAREQVGCKSLLTGFSDAHICAFVCLPSLLENKASHSLLFSRQHRQLLHSLMKHSSEQNMDGDYKKWSCQPYKDIVVALSWRQPTPPSATQQPKDL